MPKRSSASSAAGVGRVATTRPGAGRPGEAEEDGPRHGETPGGRDRGGPARDRGRSAAEEACREGSERTTSSWCRSRPPVRRAAREVARPWARASLRVARCLDTSWKVFVSPSQPAERGYGDMVAEHDPGRWFKPSTRDHGRCALCCHNRRVSFNPVSPDGAPFMVIFLNTKHAVWHTAGLLPQYTHNAHEKSIPERTMEDENYVNW